MLQPNTPLIAIQECRMNKDNRPTLTINKTYLIDSIDNTEKQFCIIDDENEAHWFDIHDYYEFFKLT